MQKFCHHCGKQVVVGSNFCPFCGTDLKSLSSKPAPAPAPAQAKASATFTPFSPTADDDDDDTYIDRIEKLDIRINKLDVDIIKDRPVNETVASLISQGPSSEKIVRDAPANVDSKTFLEEFGREAGKRGPNEPPRAA